MKRTVCFIMAIAMALSMVVSTAHAKTVTDTLFEQDFDDNLTGVTQAQFKTVARPADGSDTYTNYTPDGTKDGAFKSDITSTAKATVSFGEKFTGTFAFEADFRLEGRAYATNSGQVKFFDAFSSTGKNIFMITSGTCFSDGYSFRPVYTKEDGSLHVGQAGANLEYKKWYHLKVEITTDADADMGTMAFYIDGEKRCEGYSRNGKAFGNLNDLATIELYQAADGTFPFIVDNIKITKERAASSDNSVTSEEFSVSENEIGVWDGATVIDLLSGISYNNAATAKVTSAEGVEKTSGKLSDGDVLIITAEDETTKSYTVKLNIEKPYSYIQSFNENSEGVTLNGFEIVDKIGAAYTPDGTKDGVLRSILGSKNKARLLFDKTYGGESEISFDFCYEAFDGKNISNGNIKLADVKNGKDQTIMLVTVGNPTSSGYQLRVGTTAYKTPALLNYGQWYNLKIQLHEKTAKLDVYLDGALVDEGLAAWQNASPVTARAIEVYSSVDTNTKYHYIDNVKATEKFTVKTSASEGGKLIKGGTEAPSEEALKSGTYSYTAAADDGYAIDTITVTQGENVTYPTANASGSFDVTINEDTEIAVTFKTAETAGIAKTELITGTRTVGDKQYNTYAVYASVTGASGVTAYGAVLENSENVRMELSGGDVSGMQKIGKFAILVYGDGLKGQTCTLTPFITTADGTVSGDKTTEFTD